MPKKIFIAITAFAIVAAGITLFFDTQKTESKANITSGLKAYYKLDEISWNGTAGEVRDGSLSGINGKATGATTTAYSKYGRAGTFDGFDDSVDFNTASAHQIVNDLTISAWVYPRGFGMVLAEDASGETAATNVLYWMAVSPGIGGYIDYFWETGSGTNHEITHSIDSIPSQTWSYITITRKQNGATDDISFYFNGRLLQIYTGQVRHGSTEGTSSKLSIGRKLSGGPDFAFLNAIIDEVRIYNRALSATEIATLYGSTKINSAPKNQLVGYWTLDQNDIRYAGTATTTYDKSGFNNTGTFSIGANTYGATSTPGQIKQAISLDGSDYVSASHSASLSPTTALTISAWIKQNTIAGNKYFISKGTTADGYHIYDDGSAVSFFLAGDGSGINSGSRCVGVWCHIVATWDGATEKIYRDGAFQSQQAHISAITYSNDTFYIGAYDGGVNSPVADIDDVRIYNYALSAAEISQLYNAAKIMRINSANNTGLVGYWPMDATDVSGTTIYSRGGVVPNSGAMTGTTNASGIKKQARNFNGTSNVILVSKDTDQGSLDLTQQVTMSAWIYPTSTQTPMTVMEKDYDYKGYALYILNGNHLHADVFNGSGTTIAEGGTIKQNQWNFVAGTYDGTNIRAYVDGVQVGIAAGPSSIGIPNVSLRFGAWFNLGSGLPERFFKGRMDEVRLYNRALSAQEIANLYNATKLFRSQ